MIDFNKPLYLGTEPKYVLDAIVKNKLSGDGSFTKKCSKWFENKFDVEKVLMTTSCTHALEMAAILCDIKPGDEVICPSFTFVSTVNAFVLRGAKIVFVDIRPDTMNIDETLIEQAITNRTKVIVPVHYAGVACEMDTIMAVARRYDLLVVEDAAQAVMATYKGKPLGTIGDFGTFSFHETKNYTMGEGGSLLINTKKYIERAEIIREKGTNRSQFHRGEIDKYSWVDVGSSYLSSELNVAYLYPQLLVADEINEHRLNIWNLYYESLSELEQLNLIELPTIPEECAHNAHMFYIKCEDEHERKHLIEFLRNNGVMAVFHYVPLHSSVAGKKYSSFHGEDRYTTHESLRILRLPMYYGLDKEVVHKITELIKQFYNAN